MKLPCGFAYLHSWLAQRRARHRVRRAVLHAEALIHVYGRALGDAVESASLVTDPKYAVSIGGNTFVTGHPVESASLVTDLKYLPASKDALETALLIAMHAQSDPRQISLMKAGYLLLSQFQPGVGDVVVTFQPRSIPDDPVALAQAVSELMPEYMRWQDAMRQEEEQLAAELSRAGF